MYKIPRRSPRKKIHKLWKSLIALFSLYCLISFAGSFFGLWKMNRELAGANQQLENLKIKKAQLETRIKQVHSDVYVEKIAREQLGLVRRDETLIITTNTSNTSKKPGGWKIDPDQQKEGKLPSKVTD